MIVRDHLPWIRIWPGVSRRLGLLFFFDTTVAMLYTFAGAKFLALPELPLAIMGGAISIFLAFRTNSAYDRWWEARILWGGLVNFSRTFARQVLTMFDRDVRSGDAVRSFQRLLVLRMIAFTCALRCHLRGQNPFPELEGILGPSDTEGFRSHTNVPAAILLEMGVSLRHAYERGWIDSMRWTSFDRSLTELTNIQGACERIKNTPLPRQYDFLPRLLVGFFCILLPFGLVGGLGLLTPVASTLIGFIFVALDSVGREIENPFENTVHDTPMTSLTRTIEINLRQHLGDALSPRDIKPVEGFVY
ncbi:MAG: bestrophin family ion channel [Acidobacteriota bacterium]